ncbi:KH domain-containing protein [bacterium]|nr:KH domain-containing protein [bacterium]
MKSLLETIVCAIVDQPDAVNIEQHDGSSTCILELSVHKDDIGKVIGKKGSHANAIRTLLDACGGRDKKKYILEILE